MIAFRRTLRMICYFPLTSYCIKPLIAFLRLTHILPPITRPNKDRLSIIVIQPHNSLGDIVLSIPFLEELHRLWPMANIDAIAGNAMCDLLLNLPFIHKVYPFTPSRGSVPAERYKNTFRLLMLCRRIGSQYDIAFDPRWESDGHASLARSMSFFLGCHMRVSYSGHVDNYDTTIDQFMTHVAQGGRDEHELIRKLRLLQRVSLSDRIIEDDEIYKVSLPLLAIAESGRPLAIRILDDVSIAEGERFVVLAPSASTPAKIWPVRHLASIARSIYAEFGFRSLIVGTLQDFDICNKTASESDGVAVSVAGKTNITELVAILRRATLFIGNDSGPAHLSAMVGTPTVVTLTGRSTSEALDNINAPRRFRPCGPHVKLVQPSRPLSPCGPVCLSNEAHCITEVPIQSVLAACKEFLTNCSFHLRKTEL